MTETEQRYAQIEEKALALTWACDRLNQYLLGSKFILETDHKPLVPLLSSKNLDELPIGIQRFRLRMMCYSYDLRHVPGKELTTADYLSQSPIPTTEDYGLSTETNAYVNLVVTHLPATDSRLQDIKEHQHQDTVLQKWKTELLQQRKEGRKRAIYADLSIHNGLLMRGSRIVIPKKIQPDILKQLHAGHQGVVKCKERARCSVWWPGITVDIEEYIKNCETCCRHQRPRVEPLLPSKLPATPWQKVGMDLFEWRQSPYLLVVDYYSRYIEIAKLTTTTSTGVINHLKSIFARHGIPQTIVSDNGPQFSSSQFSQFTKEFHIHHVTSSPCYLQANGEAERAVQTVKGLLNRSEDPYMALLAYRSTPLKQGYSPAELLMGRLIRTTLPVISEQLRPQLPKNKDLKRRDQELKETQKQNYDQRHHASDQAVLETGDEVWITDQNKPGEIEENKGPRSYTVHTSSGTIRRNRCHLNRLPTSSSDQQTSDANETQSSSVVEMPTNFAEGPNQLNHSVAPRRSTRVSKPPDRLGVWTK